MKVIENTSVSMPIKRRSTDAPQQKLFSIASRKSSNRLRPSEAAKESLLP